MRSCELYMQLRNGEWQHSAFHPSVCRMYSDSLPIHKVRITEDPNGEYWGWWENKDKKYHYTSKVLQAVEICFAYGSRIKIEKGEGELLKVRIEDLGRA